MGLNVISYNGTDYGDSAIEQATGYGETTYVGDTLPYSTLEADIWDFGRALLQYCTNDIILLYQTQDGMWVYTQQRAKDLTSYTYGAPVTWTHRGNLLMERFLTSCKRIGKYKFRLSCVSGIGLIAESRHYGGLYSGTLFGDLLSDIIGGAFGYQIDEFVAAIPVYGWLPVATRRENLRRMLTSSGAVIRTNAQGQPWFTVPDTEEPASIQDSGIEMGGSVDYPTPYQAVKITEHAFVALSTDILKTLFDGESATEPLVSPLGVSMKGTLVTFADPMHDLQITNGTILESGVNYAVLGPSSSCTLTGLVYSHTERIVTAGSLTAEEQATKRLEDSTLVNLLNSENVAQRWYQYYSSPRKVQITAVWGGEQPSDAVSFSDPYDDPLVGIISSMDVRLSAKLTADMTILAGNLPQIVGNYYANVVVLTANTTWVAPSDVKGKIRVVLISGGQGGEDGASGASGEMGTGSGYGAGGEGGAPGTPGNGGRIYVATISAQSGQSFTAVIGIGGSRGANGSGGSLGTDSTFGSLSSASGVSSSTGYIDLINGTVYATPGGSGISGGSGSGTDTGDTVYGPDGTAYTPGETGPSVTVSGVTANGGAGGGAAVGSNGGNGYEGDVVSASGGGYQIDGGNGGAGAAATAQQNATIPGAGGPGGHGGGGGGGGAIGPGFPSQNFPGSGGPGGAGGLAGNGAPGAIIVYY